MSNKLELNKEILINEVFIPFYTGLSKKNSNYLIYNLDGTIITASESVTNMHGYTKLEQIQGKTNSQIYKFALSCPDLCNDLNNIRLEIIEKKTTIDYMCVAKFSSGIMAYIAEQSPIINTSGDVIATIVVINEIPSYNPRQDNQILSQRQSEIVFLLSIGASQKEIASIFNITRGTIAKTIENICIKLKLTGASERNIIETASKLGCGRLPITEVSPGVIRISKLYANQNILTLFHNKINIRLMGSKSAKY